MVTMKKSARLLAPVALAMLAPSGARAGDAPLEPVEPPPAAPAKQPPSEEPFPVGVFVKGQLGAGLLATYGGRFQTGVAYGLRMEVLAGRKSELGLAKETDQVGFGPYL